MGYQRELEPDFEPFDPITLTEETKELVCSGRKRKYMDFYKVGVYGGIATGYTVGCNLRCFFCWVGPGRDRPEKYGVFRSPEEAAERLDEIARKKVVDKARVSGGEPTLCREHLLELLDLIEEKEHISGFILETNGILFGNDKEYVEELKGLEKPYVRVSLKAGFPEEWEEKTGASQESFPLPYRAIQYLWDLDIDFHVAAMADPRMTSKEEMKSIYDRVAEVSLPLAENIEWESVDMYPNTKRRLKAAGKELG